MIVKSVLCLSLAAVVFADCPAFGDWREWTDQCVWFPLKEVRKSLIDACDVSVDLDSMPDPPPMPELPAACGHCSYKFRCRKREKSEDCFPLDGEKQVCEEHATVCDMPPFPLHNLGCRYEYAPYYLKQCLNRPDISEARREGYRKMMDMLPNFHCKDVNGQCKCCCHPYMPSEDGAQCVQHEVPQCDEYSDWTGWSDKCLWWPPQEIKNDIVEHCDFTMKTNPQQEEWMNKLKLPDDMTVPDRCGYCSFKVKCRKREIKSADGKKECFPFDMEKKACGADDDCPTCADTCELPKFMGSCNYTDQMRKLVGPGIKSRLKKVPHAMQMGLMKMITHLPHGKCVEKDGKCFCCCHPYEPNEDGTECLLKDVCKTPEDVGIDFDMNLPDNDAWWW
jgi:hypothetical protein